MTQNSIIDLTGRPTLNLRLNIDKPTKRAIMKLLTERHATERAKTGELPDKDFKAEAPDVIVLRLREATFREQNEWNEGRVNQGMTDPVTWTAQLIQDRCDEDFDIDVLREVVLGMDGATLAQIQQAYITGTLQDPKVLSGATTGVNTKLTAAVLAQLAAREVLEFSPDTSVFDLGNDTN